MSQTERLRYITHILNEVGFVRKKQLEQEFEVNGRTIKRDIEYLRVRCDCNIEYSRKEKAYVALEPVPRFNIGRTLLLFTYIAGMSRSLSLLPMVAKEIEKLAKKMLGPEHLALSKAIFYQHPTLEPFNSIVLDKLLFSFKRRLACSIFYTKLGKSGENRSIEPLRFVHYGGQWYILALCRSLNSLRQFNLSRINYARLTDEPFTYSGNGSELDQILNQSYGIMRLLDNEQPPVLATIRFSGKSALLMANQQWHPQQVVEFIRSNQTLPTANQSQQAIPPNLNQKSSDEYDRIQTDYQDLELTLPVDSPEEILRRVLFFGHEAEVLRPLEFRTQWLKMIQKMLDTFGKYLKVQ